MAPAGATTGSTRSRMALVKPASSSTVASCTPCGALVEALTRFPGRAWSANGARSPRRWPPHHRPLH
jgi:hypothetical protein